MRKMEFSSFFQLMLFTACLLTTSSFAGSIHGIKRLRCENRDPAQKFKDGIELTEHEKRVQALRTEMRLRSVHGHEVDAYVLSSFDEHQKLEPDDDDSRLKFISGFSGPVGDAVITLKSAALWTAKTYIELADEELDCEWNIFVLGEDPSFAMWLRKDIASDSTIGADPKTIPRHLWVEWELELKNHFLRLVKVKNLIDVVWGNRVPSRDFQIHYHNSSYTGVSWRHKVEQLREHLKRDRIDAMVVTSLTEIAYLLNLRGSDYTYLPVFRAFLIVTRNDVTLYTNKTKVAIDAQLSLHYDLKNHSCYREPCVIIKNYNDIWKDLRTHSHHWKRVMLPSPTASDMGASEAVHSSIWSRDVIVEQISPIVHMRAQKNDVEREGMRKSHVRDAVAMCDTFQYLEERFNEEDLWTEGMLKLQVDRSRQEIEGIKGKSFQTIVAFGANAAKDYYHPLLRSKNDAEITDQNLLLVDSGGQYLDGTTSIARTIHLGKPTAEQKKAYTKVLQGLIRLSMLVFPDNIKPSEIDTLLRGPLWSSRQDYQQISGTGIGSYLSVEESPINIGYTTTKQEFVFREGYFFSVAPGYYKQHDFGIRLKNVFEVVDTGDRHQSGAKFLAFRVVTLFPFDAKLIDRTLLSQEEKKWLNQYNARIRQEVGTELKRNWDKLSKPLFHWLMNHTDHIREYITESEYRSSSINSGSQSIFEFNFFLIVSFILCIVKSLL